MSVLFGPSGAGKSLTLSLIAGLIRPDTGSIAINGQVVTDCARRLFVSPQDRRVGMVFQDGLLLPHRSVLDNVALAVRQTKGRRERRAVARSWLERVGAEAWSNRRPGSLSGGQRQRVALARALVAQPRLLLLDEPLGALDALTRIEMQTLIETVWLAQRFTAILVTHDVAEAVALADRIIVLHGGKVAYELRVAHPRPRRRGSAELAALEGRLLAHLLRKEGEHGRAMERLRASAAR